MSSILPCNFQLQVLQTEAWAKEFISSVHYCRHGIFGKFQSIEYVSKHSNRFDTVAPMSFKHLSKLSFEHRVLAAPVEPKSNPVNTNTVATNPQHGAFSLKKIQQWWSGLWVILSHTLI